VTDYKRPDFVLSSVASITAAFLSRNGVAQDEIPDLIRLIHASLSKLGSMPKEAKAVANQPPAVPIRKSVRSDYIICLEDGVKRKILTRHLRTLYGMTPDQYRAKWNLPSDYPMVAPNYSAVRSRFARDNGLGKSRGDRANAKPTRE
jgi:predicted transcriptional regulator